MVKKTLELLGNVPNSISFPSNTIEAYKVNEDETEKYTIESRI